MLDDDDFQVPETRYAAQCPHCTERLQFQQDGDQLQLDDPASCHFHGVIGTRRDILRAIKNGHTDGSVRRTEYAAAKGAE